ncbi:MAG: hypothetical protein ACLQGV_17825 [Bryobacteraceae bacterium]
MYEIRKSGVLRNSKIAAAMCLVIGAAIMIPMTLFGTIFAGNHAIPIVLLMLLMPIGWAVLGFVSTAITCVIYNLIAPMVGGIKVELKAKQETGYLAL